VSLMRSTLLLPFFYLLRRKNRLLKLRFGGGSVRKFPVMLYCTTALCCVTSPRLFFYDNCLLSILYDFLDNYWCLPKDSARCVENTALGMG